MGEVLIYIRFLRPPGIGNAEMPNTSFELFFQTSSLRKRVEEKLLQVARRMRNDPDWIPTGILSGGRLGFFLWTRKLMMRIWKIQQCPSARKFSAKFFFCIFPAEEFPAGRLAQSDD